MFKKKRDLGRMDALISFAKKLQALQMQIDDLEIAQQQQKKRRLNQIKEANYQKAKVQYKIKIPQVSEMSEQKKEIIQKCQSKVEDSIKVDQKEMVPKKALQGKEILQQVSQQEQILNMAEGQSIEQLHFWKFINRIFGNISPNLYSRKKAPKINLKFSKSFDLQKKVEQIKKAKNLIQLIIEKYKEQINTIDKQSQLSLKLKLYIIYTMFMGELKQIKKEDQILYKISKEFIHQMLRQNYCDGKMKNVVKKIEQMEKNTNTPELIKLQQLD